MNEKRTTTEVSIAIQVAEKLNANSNKYDKGEQTSYHLGARTEEYSQCIMITNLRRRGGTTSGSGSSNTAQKRVYY